MKGKKKTLFASVFVVLIVLSGCSTTSVNYNEVYYNGNLGVDNDTFRMDGVIQLGLGAQPSVNYTNVSIVLYDGNKERTRRVPIGYLSSEPGDNNLSLNVSITSQKIPKYVVIESPDFWTYNENLQIESFRYANVSYESYFRTNNQMFPTSERRLILRQLETGEPGEGSTRLE